MALVIAPAAAREPHAHQIAALLMRYFAAINSHNAGAYAYLFIPALRAGLRHLTPGYRSTTDSDERLTGLFATGPLGLAATLTFTSHQSPVDSPDQAACDRWDITVFLKHTSTGYRIRRPRPGFPDTVQPCG